MLPSKAIECFVGAWGFINATLTNTTTGQLIPEWHSVNPSGMTVYSPSGYNSFIITANDTTEAAKRPKELTLPAKPTDPDSRWALVGKYSLGAGGPVEFTNITGRCSYGGKKDGKKELAGVMKATFATATLPAWVGLTLENNFEFFNGGNVHVLRTYFGIDILQTVFFYRLADTPSSAA